MDKIDRMKRILAEAKAHGHIVGVQFVKRDGTHRVMAFRQGLAIGLTGGRPEATEKRNATLNEQGMLTVYDLKKVGYRTVNLNTVQKIRSGGKTYWF